MLSVNELCRRTGVSRKTLYYYDKIGLLKPSERYGVQKAKLYDEEDAERLSKILAYREAGLSLHEIGEILECAEEEKIHILEAVIKRLEKERDRLDLEIAKAREFLNQI